MCLIPYVSVDRKGPFRVESIRYRTFRPHIVLHVWVIAWLLAVPLFHVHPETEQHHGEVGHIHGGTFHTVFSGDLDGEFVPHEHGADTPTAAGSALPLVAEISHAWEEHPELAFSLLSDSTGRKLLKPFPTYILSVAPTVMPVLERRDQPEQDGASAFSSTFLLREIPARAPPSTFLG